MKIFVQQYDNKFINNLIISLRQMSQETISTNIVNNLYKLDYLYKFDTYVFIADLFSNEIAQFISEYHNKNEKRFFIYYPSNHRYEELSPFNKVCKVITWNNSSNHIIVPQNILNTSLFASNATTKQNCAVLFLDQCQEGIPDAIESYLYPNTVLPIKMFNNNHINHVQNLGLLNEFNKAEVLRQSRFFINLNNYYVMEAVACGCDVVDINRLTKSKKSKNFLTDISMTRSTKQSILSAISYTQFIEQNIL
jgi:hypothetical protein